MKNFVKLIQQAHEERYFIALTKMFEKKIPVAFLSISSLNQAVETAEDFRAQGLNVTNLLTIDDSPFDRRNLDFNIVNVNNAAKIYPRPEYVWVTDNRSTNFAKKFMGDCKIVMPILIRRKNSDQVYEIFMSHLTELQEVYRKRAVKAPCFSCGDETALKILANNKFMFYNAKKLFDER